MNKNSTNNLPKLKVISEDYCSQETVDLVIDYLEKNRPEKISLLYDYGEYEGVGKYVYLAKLIPGAYSDSRKSFHLSSNPIADLDVAYELWRRIKAARGLDAPAIKGYSFAPTIDGPFPARPKIPIHPRSITGQVPQEIIDKILDDHYSKYPQWWYIVGEAARRSVGPYAQIPYPADYFKNMILLECEPKDLEAAIESVSNEVEHCAAFMCGIHSS